MILFIGTAACRAIATCLFLLVGGTYGYPGQMMDRLPRGYEAQLRVLNMALALNREWSPVWSEKLNPGVASLEQPDPEFCTRLLTVEDAPIDTYDVIKKIVDRCSFSGMYVDHGVRLLSHSVQCFFHRHARVHLSAVNVMLSRVDETFTGYLKNLIEDYRLVADKLVAVGASLKHVVQLVTFFNDVEKLSVKLTPNSKELENVKKILRKIQKRVDRDFDKFCAVTGNDWYDDVGKTFVSMKEIKDKKGKGKDKKKDKKKKKKDEEEDEAEGKDEADKLDPHSRAEELRLIMKRVFEGLFIGEMSSEIWKEIFTDNILMKPMDLQTSTTNKPASKPVNKPTTTTKPAKADKADVIKFRFRKPKA